MCLYDVWGVEGEIVELFEHADKALEELLAGLGVKGQGSGVMGQGVGVRVQGLGIRV